MVEYPFPSPLLVKGYSNFDILNQCLLSRSAILIVVVPSIVVVVVCHLRNSLCVRVVVAVRVVDVLLHHHVPVPRLAPLAEDEESKATCDEERDSKNNSYSCGKS